MNYGCPYQGSKNKIAKWVVDILPAGDTLVDLFAGGGAITHCAALSNKWRHIIANDKGDIIQLFQNAIQGKYANEERWISREDFSRLKDSDPFVKYCWSFGNNGEGYMYSEQLEPYKKELHGMAFAKTPSETLLHWRAFLRLFKGTHDPSKRAVQEVQSLENLARLQSLERLERLESLERLELIQTDYRQVTIPDRAVVYCDPPYRNTNCGSYDGFDYIAFDEWLASVPFPVYVSEYTAPRGCIEIASIRKHVTAGTGNKGGCDTEKIFIQERFAEER